MQPYLTSSDRQFSLDPENGILGTALRQNVLLLVIVAVYFAAALVLCFVTSVPVFSGSLSSIFWMLVSLAPTFFLTMIVWRFTHMVVTVRPEKPIGWLARDLWTTLVKDHLRLASGVTAIVGVVFFATVFAYVKETIPALNPFDWDVTFAELDRQVHGGVDPYVLLSPLFAAPFMYQIADLAYSAWFLLIYFFVFLACMDQENLHRRNTFLIAFALSWVIGGSILATVFSSVGPIYFQAFGFGDDFLPLEEMLRRVNEHTPLVAVELQAMLLDGYRSGEGLSGISAMPSMHLATSWLLAFQAFRYSRALGWIMVAFAVIIQIGSVMLAWHYAIDGYAGFLIAVFCWFTGAKLAGLQGRINGA